MISWNNKSKNNSKICSNPTIKEDLMEILNKNEESEESQLAETQSARDAIMPINWKLISYNSKTISIHLQESCCLKEEDEKREGGDANKFQTERLKVFWDTKKAIKGWNVEEIKNNILKTVFESIDKTDKILQKNEVQL